MSRFISTLSWCVGEGRAYEQCSLFSSFSQEYFRQFYPSVRSAKVITDASTGRSKGYGFVRFRWGMASWATAGRLLHALQPAFSSSA